MSLFKKITNKFNKKTEALNIVIQQEFVENNIQNEFQNNKEYNEEPQYNDWGEIEQDPVSPNWTNKETFIEDRPTYLMNDEKNEENILFTPFTEEEN